MRPIDADKLIEDGWILQQTLCYPYHKHVIGRKSIADVPTIKFDELQKYLQDESFV